MSKGYFFKRDRDLSVIKHFRGRYPSPSEVPPVKCYKKMKINLFKLLKKFFGSNILRYGENVQYVTTFFSRERGFANE
jgi:hypothetical protein